MNTPPVRGSLGLRRMASAHPARNDFTHASGMFSDLWIMRNRIRLCRASAHDSIRVNDWKRKLTRNLAPEWNDTGNGDGPGKVARAARSECLTANADGGLVILGNGS